VTPHDIQFKSNPGIYKGYERRIFNFLYGYDFKTRSRIIAISDYDQGEVGKYYPSCAEKVVRIHNPVIFDKRQEDADQRPMKKAYIFANNLAYIHKNLGTLLQAFDRVKDQVIQELVIAGSIYGGDQEATKLMGKLMDEGRLILTGYLPKEEFDLWLEHADLLVNPSSFEGFGLSAVEGMYAKVPCLVADNSAVREVTLGRADYYAPATDAEQLGQKMVEVLARPRDDAYRALSSELIQNKYSYLKIAEDYLEQLS
jgi:glycosyltransferase involved in cell wall biosynthesis